MAQRIRHLTTNQGIAGSSPARVKFSFRPKWIVTFRLDLSSLNRGQILFKSTSYLRQCLPREKYMASWRENKIIHAPPGGLEPPTFRLTAERASRLRHGGKCICLSFDTCAPPPPPPGVVWHYFQYGRNESPTEKSHGQDKPDLRRKILRQPGVEPGSTAWKAAMLTIIPPTLELSELNI